MSSVEEYEQKQDVFISHASADKARYILPLVDELDSAGVTYWLDTQKIGWGESVIGGINQGLRSSKFVLLCLSEEFLRRPWPEAEMEAVLAAQTTEGVRRALPLILNAKNAVLAKYPLLARYAYRTWDAGPAGIARELSWLVGSERDMDSDPNVALILIESVHTGKLCRLRAPRAASISWLADKAAAGLELEQHVGFGGHEPLSLRYVLVDSDVEDKWSALSPYEQVRIHALLRREDGSLGRVDSRRDRIGAAGVRSGTTFHLYAVQDLDRTPPPVAAPLREYAPFDETVLAPEGFVAVLKWGRLPKDLDLHVSIRAVDDPQSTREVDYRNQGQLTAFPWVALNRDVRDGYGPEVILCEQLQNNLRYRVFVVNYSGEASWTQSEAVVLLRVGDSPAQVIQCSEAVIRDNGNDTKSLWLVADIVEGQVLYRNELLSAPQVLGTRNSHG